MAIDISVVVPVYNTEKHLKECVDSIIAQTVFDRIELILVDDGSTDGSPAICDAYANDYANIRVIHQRNAGVSAARNAGIRVAAAKYIGFVDSDDFIFPAMYERLLAAAETSEADMSFCGFIHSYPEGDVRILYPFPEKTAMKKEQILGIICPFLLEDGSMNSCCNKLLKTQTILGNDIFFTQRKRHGEDREFLLKILAEAETLCYEAFTGYYYRRVSSSAVQKARLDYADDILTQYKSDISLFEKIGMATADIKKRNAKIFAEQVLNAIVFSYGKLKGPDMRKTVRSLIENPQIRAVLKETRGERAGKMSSFDKLLLVCVQLKCLPCIAAVIAAMKIRVALYNKAGSVKTNG